MNYPETMSKRSVALLIFTKSPVEGHVKTRLIPQWGSHGALLLYQDMIKATIEMTQRSSIEDIIIYRTPGDESPFLQSCSIHYELPLMEQHGPDLGDRMHNAIHEHLKTHESVIIIGCDCPELSEEELHKTIKGLNTDADIVLGPCEDGGYYLMGMNQEYPELFSGIDWGTSDVMEQTRKRINSLGLNSCELDIKWDVDRPEDVFRYMGRLEHEG
jgi:rSAM/selenodomain-associated transferase 1